MTRGAIPEPGDGQMLLRTEYLSLDPYMRGRMSDAPSYAPPVEIEAVMVGGTVLCGLVSQYNATELPSGPDRMNRLMGQLLRKRILMQGFIIFDDFGHLYPEFARQMAGWVAGGRIHYREEIIDGLDNAPAALIGLLKGENFGKRMIRVTT